MITVVHIITGLNTGGAEMMLYKLLSGLDSSKFSSHVIALSSKGALIPKFESLGIPIHFIPFSKRPGSVLQFLKLKRKISEISPDLIQGWMYHGNLFTTLSNSLKNVSIPTLWNIRHSLYDLKYEKFTTRAIIQTSAKISHRPIKILYNSVAASKQHEKLGFSAKKTKIIPNGFDLDQFIPRKELKTALAKKFNLPKELFWIGMAARCHPMKDPLNFLKAAKLFLKKNQNSHFFLVGRGMTNNNEISTFIAENHMQKKVTVLEEIQGLQNFLPALDLFTLTSAWGEGFPNIIGEAMCCEIPCVATDVGDSSHVIGPTGYIVPPKNPLALSLAWQKIYELSTEQRTQLGKSARSRIQQLFTLPIIVQHYQDTFSEIIQENKKNS